MSVVGRSFASESFATLDGPGIRYVLFLQGCMMRCQYCHNRESWKRDGGTAVTVEEVMAQLRQYRAYFKSTGGGLTVSGGEALLQAEFVRDLFQAAQTEGFHTCLDTNGFYRRVDPLLDSLLDATDLVLLDLKHLDDLEHRKLTGVSNQYPLNFARYLAQRNIPTWIRQVIIPGITDSLASNRALADFIEPMNNIEKVELLPYHSLGEHKWQEAGCTSPLAKTPSPSVEVINLIGQQLQEQGVQVAL